MGKKLIGQLKINEPYIDNREAKLKVCNYIEKDERIFMYKILSVELSILHYKECNNTTNNYQDYCNDPPQAFG